MAYGIWGVMCRILVAYGISRTAYARSEKQTKVKKIRLEASEITSLMFLSFFFFAIIKEAIPECTKRHL